MVKEYTKEQIEAMSGNDRLKMSVAGLMRLEQIDEKRNTLTESEFEKYLPLYKRHSELECMKNEDVFRQLSDDFKNRVNIYKRIIIVFDDNPKKVRAILPPPCKQVGLITKQDAKRVLSFFDTEITHDRKNVRFEAQQKMTDAIIKGQKIDIEHNEHHGLQDDVFTEEVLALERLNAKHPLVVTVHNKLKQVKQSEEKENNVKKEEPVIDYDFDEDNLL